MSNYKINIIHLYPDLLDLYGDKGNIECLKKRLLWRGIDAEVINCTCENENMDIKNADIIFLGGGSAHEQKIVAEKLFEKRDEIKEFVENDGVMLAVCGGYYLLGKYYKTAEEEVKGLGILDAFTDFDARDERLIGNVVLDCEGLLNKVVGFENHSGRTNIGKHTPFGKVLKGFGNDGKSGFEGVRYKNLIGTNLHGPLLPKNPEICDRLLASALKKKYSDFEKLEPLDDDLEIKANEYMADKI